MAVMTAQAEVTAGGQQVSPAIARGAEFRRALLIGLALFLCYGFFFYPGGNWNVESRNAQIVSLAEDKTLAIDAYEYWTGDKAYYQGHYYSDKLVGPSLVAVPFYWTSRRLLQAAGMSPRLALMVALRVANVCSNAAPSALLGALLYLFLAELGLSAVLRVWLAFAYGFGTLALPYSTALFGHQFGAACAFGSFMLLWRQRGAWIGGRAVAAGLLAGLGAICDFTTLLIACFLALYAIWVSVIAASSAAPRRRVVEVIGRVLLFAVFMAVPISVQLSANWSSFGSPLTFPHIYHVQPSFRARHTAGLLGVHFPQLSPLYQLTIGPWRGLFYGCPVLLLALPGFFLLGRRRPVEAVLAAAMWIGVLLMSAGYENWTAGSSYGPRYQIAAIPFLVFAAAPSAQRWPFVFKVLAAISIAFAVIVTAQSPFIPENLQNPLAVALAEFSVGRLLNGNLGLAIGLPSLLSLLPLAVVEAAFFYALSGISAREQ
jgi:hypothetical protein